MSLFLQLHRQTLAALLAVFLDLEILPTHSFAVLLMQTDGPDSVARFGAVHCEDGALTTRHSGSTLLRNYEERKPREDHEETEEFD